jgi:O-antigen/teichoic acid export membrane protein
VTATVSARRAFRPSPFLRDVILSGLTSVLVMAALVLITGWLADGLGPDDFGAYGLSRRLLSAVIAFSPGPLGIALARAMAMAPTERDRLSYVVAGVVCAVIPALIIVAIGAAFPGAWARVFLSATRYAPVLLATLVLILGTTLYAVVFARYRGTNEIGHANLWQIWALALGPGVVAVTLARTGRLAVILALMGVVTLTAVIPLLGWLYAAVRQGIGWSELRPKLADLMRYSVPRVPGGVAFAGLFAVGPFLAPYFSDLRHAGFLVAGQSVLRIVEGGSSGFGMVALPRVAALQARQSTAGMRERVEDLIAMVVHLGLFATCQLSLWAPEIVLVWLGPSYRDAIPLVRVLLLSVVPYLGYTMLRSVIDGLEERAINARNTYIAFAVTAGLSLALGFAGYGALGLAVAGSLGFALLGVLSALHLRRALGLRTVGLGIRAALSVNLAATLASLALNLVLASRMGPASRLAAGAALGLALFLSYLVVLKRLRVRWLLELERRLLPHRAAP